MSNLPVLERIVERSENRLPVLSEVFDQVVKGTIDPSTFQALAPQRRGWIGSLVRNYEVSMVQKAIGKMALAEHRAWVEARTQGADIREPAPTAETMWSMAPGVRMVTGMSFDTMRNCAALCEPLAAIIDHGVTQAAAYTQPSDISEDRSDQAGWTVVMVDGDATPEEDDLKQMKIIRDYITNCGLPVKNGFTVPPEGERPLSWKPNFEYFVRQFVRDSLTFDWAIVRRWSSDANPTRYPCATFAAIDSSRIYRTLPSIVQLKDGVPEYTPFRGERINCELPIEFVKTGMGNRQGQILANYNANEIAPWVRNPRTDEGVNGYGYSEIERAANIIKGWVYGLLTNVTRFEKDAIPPGLLLLFANMTQQQLASYQIQWAQNHRGIRNRWRFPILPVVPGQGTGAEWISMSQTSRDMEYHQFMFLNALVLHILYKMHPSSTGWDVLNPTRSPLSEASPEAKFERGDDTFLSPLLRSLSTFINTELLWINPVWDRRYAIKFVGLGDYDLLQDAQTALVQLQAGITNTEILWAERDRKMPKILREHPIYKEAILLPMPFAQAVQVVMQQQQQAAMQHQDNMNNVAGMMQAGQDEGDGSQGNGFSHGRQTMRELFGGQQQESGQDLTPRSYAEGEGTANRASSNGNGHRLNKAFLQ